MSLSLRARTPFSSKADLRIGLVVCYYASMAKHKPRYIPAFPIKRNKYNAKATIYRGWRFDSKAEAEYAKVLDQQIETGHVHFWMRQVPFDITEDDRYKCDFLVFYTNGEVAAVDVKGVETESWRRTRRLWIKYGPMPLHVVKKGRITETLWNGETHKED